jgi:hypothetical protein
MVLSVQCQSEPLALPPRKSQDIYLVESILMDIFAK